MAPGRGVQRHTPALRHRGEYPAPRGSTAWAVEHGSLFIFGGEVAPTPPDCVYAEVEAYDPATDRWESYAPMPTPRHAPAVGDKTYVISGNTRTGGGSASPVNEVFEPE